MTGLTLLLTVFVAMAIGIYLGYRVITGILHLMGNRPEAEPRAGVLITSQAHFGD